MSIFKSERYENSDSLIVEKLELIVNDGQPWHPPLTFMDSTLVPGVDFFFFAITMVPLLTHFGMQVTEVKLPLPKSVTTVEEAFASIESAVKEFQTAYGKALEMEASKKKIITPQNPPLKLIKP